MLPTILSPIKLGSQKKHLLHRGSILQNKITKVLFSLCQMSITSIAPSPSTNVTYEKCQTLEWSGPQATTTILVQFSLFVVCATTLLVKYFIFEKPRRPCQIWFADASKQGFGAALAHIYNLVLAQVLVSNTTAGDPCAWYFINITIDTFIGVLVQFVLIDFLEQFAKRKRIASLSRSGDYGDPPQVQWWFKQLFAYCFIVSFVKMTSFGLVFLVRNQLNALGLWIWSPFVGYPLTELILVMIVTPSLMNAWQFWVTDTFIMMFSGKERYPAWCCCLCKRCGLVKDGSDNDGTGEYDNPSSSLLNDSLYGATLNGISRESSFSGSAHAHFEPTDEI